GEGDPSVLPREGGPSGAGGQHDQQQAHHHRAQGQMRDDSVAHNSSSCVLHAAEPHRGSPSWLPEILVRPVPSVFMTHTANLEKSPESRSKVILSPAGANEGLKS